MPSNSIPVPGDPAPAQHTSSGPSTPNHVPEETLETSVRTPGEEITKPAASTVDLTSRSPVQTENLASSQGVNTNASGKSCTTTIYCETNGPTVGTGHVSYASTKRLNESYRKGTQQREWGIVATGGRPRQKLVESSPPTSATRDTHTGAQSSRQLLQTTVKPSSKQQKQQWEQSLQHSIQTTPQTGWQQPRTQPSRSASLNQLGINRDRISGHNPSPVRSLALSDAQVATTPSTDWRKHAMGPRAPTTKTLPQRHDNSGGSSGNGATLWPSLTQQTKPRSKATSSPSSFQTTATPGKLQGAWASRK